MISVKNIYYMLSYAFQILNEQGYKNVSTEKFENVSELCAAILAKGMSSQIKRGLAKEYIPQTEPLSSLRGKINVSESIKTLSPLKKQLICEYDDFSINFYMNQIIKSTLELLLHSDISKSRKKELRKILVLLSDVDSIDIYSINWNFRYNRNNQTYRMLVSVCYLVIKGLLQSNSDGSTRLMDFLDEQRMYRLYEKFILEYYRKEFPELSATASQINWQIDDGIGDMLPVMQSDIMLTHQDKTLIIDAKYYSHSTQKQYDTHTIHSGNLYQIFTYVKNKTAECANIAHDVSGLLLYARTDEIVLPDNTYHMSGNKISVKTLDLSQDFSVIASQLNAIIHDHFGQGTY